MIILYMRRLNAHLLSILSSKSSFFVVVDLLGRALTTDNDNMQTSPGRLSSFGFSGTIAHGAFAA